MVALDILDTTARTLAFFHRPGGHHRVNSLAMLSSSNPPVPVRVLLEQLASGGVVKPDATGGTNYSHCGVAMPCVDDLLQQVLDDP